MASIGLAMIAKDEADVICRALDSVQTLVDYVLVVDTGSSDNTQLMVEDWLSKNHIEGAVLNQEWVDFAHNRSLALATLRHFDDIDYALVLDADDMLRTISHGQAVAVKANLSADAYTIDVYHGTIQHYRMQLVSNRKPFFYRGIVHEFLDCRETFTTGHLDQLALLVVGGGTRSRDPNTYREDALKLQAALAANTEPDLAHRYTFYLAQSWRDCAEPDRALEAYRKRASMGGWVEEVYVSLLNAARLQEQLKYPLNATVKTYRQAIEKLPQRAEAIYGAAKLLRLADLFSESYAVACRGIALPLHRGLFVEPWIYQYGMLDEYSVSAYWAGRYNESWLAAELILRSVPLDQTNETRIRANAEFARQRCPT